MVGRSVWRMAYAVTWIGLATACSTFDTSGTIDVVHMLPGSMANNLRLAIGRVEIIFDEPVGSDQLFLSPRGESAVDFGGGIQGSYSVADADGDQKYEGLTVVNANPFSDSLTWTSQYYSEAKLGGGFWIRGKIYSGTSPQTLVAEAVATVTDGTQGTIQFGGGLKTVTLTYTCLVGVNCATSTDAGVDAGADADAGVDAGADADAGVDAGADAGADASVVTVANILPRYGVVGAAVSISGSGFSPNISVNTVSFGGALATVTDASATRLEVVAPASFSGPVSVSVSGVGTADAGEFSFLYVTAVRETLMHHDAGVRTIGIEGSFYAQPGYAYQVRYETSGGGGVTSASLNIDAGQTRLEAPLPANATAASVSISMVTPSIVIGTLPFRLARFPLALGPFSLTYEQLDVARPAPSLITARVGHCTVKAGPYLYVIGGGYSGGYLDTIERAVINADGTLGAFAALTTPALQAARGYHRCVVIGSRLHVIGGKAGGGVITGSQSVETATIGADGTIGSFSSGGEGAPLATPRSGFVLQVIGPYLYVVGGKTTVALDSVERAPILANGTLGAFSANGQPVLSTVRNAAAGMVLGSKFYVVGGENDTPAWLDSYDVATINADGTLGIFANAGAPKLNSGRRGHASLVLGGLAYFLGGFNGTSYMAEIDWAQVPTDGTLPSTTSSVADLQVARADHTVDVIGNYVYAIGGYNESGKIATIERAPIIGDAHVLGNAATVSTSFNTPRDGVAVVVLGNYLYAIGGADSQYHSLSTIERAPIYADGTIGSFVTDAGGPMVYPRSSAALAVAGDRLYVMGGAYDSGVYPAPTESAPIGSDNTLGFFVTGRSLLYPRTRITSAVLSNRLYAFGGWEPLGESNDVEYLTLDPLGGFDGGATHADMLGTSRSGGRTVVMNGRVWIVGGDTASGSTKEGQASHIDDAGVITAFLDGGILLGDARESFGAAMVGDYMYVFGGIVAGPPVNSAERARIDPYTRSFVSLFSAGGASLFEGRARPGAIVIGDGLFVLGGNGDAGALSSIERFPIQ